MVGATEGADALTFQQPREARHPVDSDGATSRFTRTIPGSVERNLLHTASHTVGAVGVGVTGAIVHKLNVARAPRFAIHGQISQTGTDGFGGARACSALGLRGLRRNLAEASRIDGSRARISLFAHIRAITAGQAEPRHAYRRDEHPRSARPATTQERQSEQEEAREPPRTVSTGRAAGGRLRCNRRAAVERCIDTGVDLCVAGRVFLDDGHIGITFVTQSIAVAVGLIGVRLFRAVVTVVGNGIEVTILDAAPALEPAVVAALYQAIDRATGGLYVAPLTGVELAISAGGGIAHLALPSLLTEADPLQQRAAAAAGRDRHNHIGTGLAAPARVAVAAYPRRTDGVRRRAVVVAIGSGQAAVPAVVSRGAVADCGNHARAIRLRVTDIPAAAGAVGTGPRAAEAIKCDARAIGRR